LPRPYSEFAQSPDVPAPLPDTATTSSPLPSHLNPPPALSPALVTRPPGYGTVILKPRCIPSRATKVGFFLSPGLPTLNTLQLAHTMAASVSGIRKLVNRTEMI